MRRGLNLILCSLIMIILLSAMIIAEDADSGTDADASKGAQLINEIRNAPQNPLDKTISIPDYIRTPAAIIFGVNEDISIEILIVLVMVWLLFFVVITNALKLTPFFNSGWTALVGSFAISSLIGFSGAIRNIAIFLIGIGDIFDFLGRLNPGAIIFALVLIGVIFAVISKILGIFRNMKEQAELEGSKAEGAKIGAELGFIKNMRKMLSFTKKI